MPDSDTGAHSIGGSLGLEEDDIAFLEQLIAEAETPLDGADECRAVRKAMLQRLENHKETLTKADLYEFDRLVLELASQDEVRAQAPGLYRRYCQERALPVDPNDPAMNPPPPGIEKEAEKINALRARMLEILRALHWSYTFGPIRERRRTKLIWDCMVVMLAATVIMGALVAIFRNVDQPFFAMLATVVYAGVLGGAVSCSRRLGSISTTDDALGSIYALKNSRYALIFAPITGAVFAVITMLLFVGKVLTGTVFPAFTELTGGAPAAGTWPFAHALLPSTSAGYALLFLWCFIAGFAERFIPDTLDALTKRAAAQKAETPKEPGAAPK